MSKNELDEHLESVGSVKSINKGGPFGPYTLVKTTKKQSGYNGTDSLSRYVSKSMRDFIFTDKSIKLTRKIRNIIGQIKSEDNMIKVRPLIKKRDKLIAELNNHRLQEEGKKIQQNVLDDVIKLKAIPEKYKFLLYNNEEDFFVKNVYDENQTIIDKQVCIFGQVEHDLDKQEKFKRIWKEAKDLQKKGGKKRTRKNKERHTKKHKKSKRQSTKKHRKTRKH